MMMIQLFCILVVTFYLSTAIEDNKTCYVCKKEPLTVTINPCNHKIGSICGYRWNILCAGWYCPHCETPISSLDGLDDFYDTYENVSTNGVCVCKNEYASGYTLSPCGHSVGYICGSLLKKINRPICPICFNNILLFDEIKPLEVDTRLGCSIILQNVLQCCWPLKEKE
ncbi:uncharacterized protein LOC126906047 isoform X2 [Daktulosphaira vitifoliae]|uniref:uncharacterized protein LOC126906047 isoform X2 n=1 Tax=Daktulosphaira vitifoliae TaxID=58002 RepID=UPI0021AA025A|nr:uncharacterized protein LOC126906047 isoform X2 [Daktulosphaira vitifoliae]